MASKGKKKTTFAKLARESRLRERRIDKQVRKDARRRAAELGPGDDGDGDEAVNVLSPAEPGDEPELAHEPVPQADQPV